ncbi:MAG: cytochrome C oxidase subunit IV family protein [Bacteroidota bacterium]|nr:cytochrome C oxidase subunit IV family protein [Bacteroidota bacterium]
MSAQITSPIVVTDADTAHVKKIWKAFWILLILTIIELILGLIIYNIDKTPDPSESLILAIKGTICILTLAKAFYIISIFMHLGDEVRNMILSIAMPAGIFIWFIIAFIVDGNSYKNLRNTDAGSRTYIEQTHHAPATGPSEKSDKKLD